MQNGQRYLQSVQTTASLETQEFRKQIAEFSSWIITNNHCPICLDLALEITRFKLEYNESVFRIIMEGISLPHHCFKATQGTKNEREFYTRLIGDYATNHAPLSEQEKNIINSMGVFKPTVNSRRGRKKSGDFDRNVSHTQTIYERRKTQGCFTFPESREAIIEAGPVMSVEAIQAQDDAELEEWLSERAKDGVLLHDDPESLSFLEAVRKSPVQANRRSMMRVMAM